MSSQNKIKSMSWKFEDKIFRTKYIPQSQGYFLTSLSTSDLELNIKISPFIFRCSQPLFLVSFYCGLFVGPLPKLTYLVLVWISTNEFVCFGTGFLVPCIWAKIKIWIESKFFGYIFYVQFCFVLVWLQTCSEDSILNLIASFS